MSEAKTIAYKACVAANYHNGRVVFTTYIGAKSEADASVKLDREGYEVLSLELVELSHIGGEITKDQGG